MRSRGAAGIWSILAVAGAIGAATALASWQAPFRDTLGAYSTDLGPRSPEQRRNIEAGASRLDGTVLEPGETLSFNAVVGPRTLERGFVSAPAFLEGTRLASIGGGICLLSSSLYDAALAADLAVTQRVPHDRVVQSVPPGADATVWYGKADLAFVNTSGAPVRVDARITGDRLTVRLTGKQRGKAPAIVRERVAPRRPGTVRVQTWRSAADRRDLLADDSYRTGSPSSVSQASPRWAPLSVTGRR